MSHDLKPHPTISKPDGPVLVCILDGFGENVYKDEFNAVHSAATPTIDAMRAVSSRSRTVRAHGKAIGLPTDDDMGNSEVGHNALGSGQLIAQGASLVDKALSSGTMFTGAGWHYISPAFSNNTVHFIGLLSDGGVHSRCDQLYGCIKGAVAHGAKKIRCHILTDGRDVPDGSSIKFVEELEAVLKATGVDAKIASGGGRMHVTMDRYEVSRSSLGDVLLNYMYLCPIAKPYSHERPIGTLSSAAGMRMCWGSRPTSSPMLPRPSRRSGWEGEDNG